MFKIALVLLVVCFLGVQISDQSYIGAEIEDRETDDQLAEKEWTSFKVLLEIIIWFNFLVLTISVPFATFLY